MAVLICCKIYYFLKYYPQQFQITLQTVRFLFSQVEFTPFGHFLLSYMIILNNYTTGIHQQIKAISVSILKPLMYELWPFLRDTSNPHIKSMLKAVALICLSVF